MKRSFSPGSLIAVIVVAAAVGYSDVTPGFGQEVLSIRPAPGATSGDSNARVALRPSGSESNARVESQSTVTYRPLPTVTYSPVVRSESTVTYSPVIEERTVTYSPAVEAPTVTYSPVASPVVTYSPVLNYASPVVTYRPAGVTTFRPVRTYSPVTTYRPMTTYRPVTTLSPAGTTVAPAAWVNPKVYVAGQPIRNLLRAITP